MISIVRALLAFSAALPFSLLLSSCEQLGISDASDSENQAASYAEVSDSRLAQIKGSGTFKVAVCPGNPPFCFKDSDGKLSGMEIDIVNAVARELKLSPQFFEVPREQAPGILRDGTADLLCGCFDGPSISRQFLSPTLEYLPSGQRAVIRSEAAAFATDLKQLNSDKITLITIQGSTGSKVSSVLFPLAKSLSVPNFEKGIEELKAGDGRAFLVSYVELLKRDNLSSDPKVKIVFGFLSSEKLAMGARRNDEKWKALLDIGFRRATLSGEIGRIAGRNFPNVSAGVIDVKSLSAGPNAELRVELGNEAPANGEAKP